MRDTTGPLSWTVAPYARQPRPALASRTGFVQAALKLRLAVAQLSVPVRRGLIRMTRIRRIRARIRANPKSGRRWAGPAAG